MSVHVAIDAGVLKLSLNQPRSKNALDHAAVSEMREAISAARENPNLRLLVLSSALPRVFCLGMDLTLFAQARSAGAWQSLAGISDYADLLIDIVMLPVPSVALVDGVAAGGGVELALVCDTVIATPNTTFVAAQLRKGLFPFITSAVVAPRIGPSQFLHWALSGQSFPARRMLELGLVNQLVAADELERTLSVFADRVSNFDPAALHAGIASLRTEFGAQTAQRIRRALSHFTLNCIAQRERAGP